MFGEEVEAPDSPGDFTQEVSRMYDITNPHADHFTRFAPCMKKCNLADSPGLPSLPDRYHPPKPEDLDIELQPSDMIMILGSQVHRFRSRPNWQRIMHNAMALSSTIMTPAHVHGEVKPSSPREEVSVLDHVKVMHPSKLPEGLSKDVAKDSPKCVHDMTVPWNFHPGQNPVSHTKQVSHMRIKQDMYMVFSQFQHRSSVRDVLLPSQV